MKNFFILAVKNLRHRGLRSWLTILGIFIGIAAVVSLITLSQGLREAITGQFSSLSTDKLMIQNAGTGFGPPGSTSVIRLNDHDIEIVKSVSGINEAIGRLIRMGRVEFNKNINYLYLGSIPDNEKQLAIVYESFNPKIEEGRLLKQDDYGKVILGSNIYNENTFGKKIVVGNKISIQGKNFEVVGLMKPASSFQLNSVILMTEKDMKELLNISDEVDLIVAQVEKGYDIESAAENLKEEFRKDRKEKIGEEDFSVQTPLQAISGVNTILNIINLIVVGIAAVSLLIGGIGIANTMYTSVLERTKEIGVMKAIGGKNKDILQIFFIESGLLGLIGGVIGAFLGLGFAFSASRLAEAALGTNILQVKISWFLIVGAILFSFVIGLLSGFLPALQASRLKPVEAFRR